MARLKTGGDNGHSGAIIQISASKTNKTGIFDSDPAVHFWDYEIFLRINQCREWIVFKFLMAGNQDSRPDRIPHPAMISFRACPATVSGISQPNR